MLPTGNAATYPYPFWPNSNMSRFKDLVRQNVNLLLRLETFEKPPYMRSVSKYDLQFREKNRVRFQPQDQTKHLLLPPYWSKHSLCAIAIPAILEILMLSSFFAYCWWHDPPINSLTSSNSWNYDTYGELLPSPRLSSLWRLRKTCLCPMERRAQMGTVLELLMSENTF